VRALALALMRGVAERGARVGWAPSSAGPLRFAVRGDPSARPLLLLHGLGDSLAGWAQVVGPLSRRYQVHLLDLPGHGLSHKPPDWKLATLSRAVADYAVQLREPVIAGHSLGGWIALRLLLSGAVRPSALALINPGGALLDRALWQPFRASVSARDREGVKAYLQRAFRRAPLLMRLLPSQVIELMWAEPAQGILDALVEEDFLREAELAAVRVPLRLIWGAHDRLLPPGSLEFFRAALPEAELVVLEKAGHLPHIEAPRELARALLRRFPS
jgi:abhydrolase domain-containing protein 6